LHRAGDKLPVDGLFKAALTEDNGGEVFCGTSWFSFGEIILGITSASFAFLTSHAFVLVTVGGFIDRPLPKDDLGFDAPADEGRVAVEGVEDFMGTAEDGRDEFLFKTPSSFRISLFRWF
jgi:hypothetical protein